MAKFKVGDKVRVIDFKENPPHWSRSGGMDKWKGKTVTLEKITRTNVTSDMEFSLREDRGEFLGHKWVWKSSDFEPVETRREFIVIRRDGAKTIAELRHDREVIKSGTAICNASDTFDFGTGAKLAFDRLMGREEPKPEPQPEHRFKVGDRVVIKATGKIGEISAISTKLLTVGCNILVAHEKGFHSGGGSDVKISKKEHDMKCEWFYPHDLSPAPAPEPQPEHRFKVGDRVVYEARGVGVVKEIDVTVMPQVPYLVEFEDDSMWLADCRLSPAPAPEPPKFYTGKVVMVDCEFPDRKHLINHLFEFKDGRQVGNKMHGMSFDYAPYTSFEQIVSIHNASTWIEVKE